MPPSAAHCIRYCVWHTYCIRNCVYHHRCHRAWSIAADTAHARTLARVHQVLQSARAYMQMQVDGARASCTLTCTCPPGTAENGWMEDMHDGCILRMSFIHSMQVLCPFDAHPPFIQNVDGWKTCMMDGWRT